MGTITWIKNNEVETKNSLFFFLSKQRKAIYDKKSVSGGNKVCIKNEVEVLHFKECTFPSYTTFECLNKDTVLIFEDCKFGHTEFIKGNIRMEHPTNTDPKTYSRVIRFYNNESVELVLADNHIPLSSNNLHVLSDVAHLHVTGNASKTTINTESSLDSFIAKNVRNLSLDVIQATNMEIESSTVKKGPILSFENLKIIDSEIESAADLLVLDGKKIEMENVTIKAKKVSLLRNIYKPKNGILTFSSAKKGDASFAQTNFISVLKAIDKKVQIGSTEQQEKIRTSIKEKNQPTIDALEEAMLPTRKNMEYYATVLMEQQATLNNIEEQQTAAMKNVEYQLTKQKVKKLIASKK